MPGFTRLFRKGALTTPVGASGQLLVHVWAGMGIVAGVVGIADEPGATINAVVISACILAATAAIVGWLTDEGPLVSSVVGPERSYRGSLPAMGPEVSVDLPSGASEQLPVAGALNWGNTATDMMPLASALLEEATGRAFVPAATRARFASDVLAQLPPTAPWTLTVEEVEFFLRTLAEAMLSRLSGVRDSWPLLGAAKPAPSASTVAGTSTGTDRTIRTSCIEDAPRTSICADSAASQLPTRRPRRWLRGR